MRRTEMVLNSVGQPIESLGSEDVLESINQVRAALAAIDAKQAAANALLIQIRDRLEKGILVKTVAAL